MQEVLSDDLPFTWATSKSEDGLYWDADSHFDTKEEFFKANPEFAGEDSRKLIRKDFKTGGVKSRLLQSCFEEGMPLEEIGSAHVEIDECGGSTVFSYFSVRRPVYIFALIENKSNQPIILKKLLSRRRETDSVEPKPFLEIKIELKAVDTAPIRIEPGESVLIPEMVLLTSPHHDDFSFIKLEYKNISREKGQELGFGSDKNLKSCNYWLVGPCDEINGFEAEVTGQILAFPFHGFKLENSYSITRYWCCGSCPHIFFQKPCGQWKYSQEILSNGFCKKDHSIIKIPQGVIKLMILEVDFEVSTIFSLTLNGQEILQEPRTLTRGESIELKVKEGDIVFIEGVYNAPIPKPLAPSHFRQKATLLKAALFDLNY